MKKVLADGTPYNATKGNPTQLDTLTGEQFKQLIEQLSPDGKINTIPELFKLLSDIPEDQTLGEYIREHGVDPEVLAQVVDTAVDEKFDEEECTTDDIDSIFDEEDVGQGGGEDTDDDDTGFETVADDGEEDV